MKESAKLCVFFAMAFTVVSLVSQEVTSYPMLESAANNNGPYSAPQAAPLPPNPEANVKDLQISLNALDR